MRCASVKDLQEIKDVTEEEAAIIRVIWHTNDAYLVASLAAVAVGRGAPDRRLWIARNGDRPAQLQDKMDAVDMVIGTCGVCFLGEMRGSGNAVYYCNAGDPYAVTVIFSGSNLRVGCWGDLMEGRAVREIRPY